MSILLSSVAAATGMAAVSLSVWHNRQRSKEREEDRRLVEEQLALAREQSEMRPRLRVTQVRLLDPRDSEALEGSVDPPWVNRLKNMRKNIRKAGTLAVVTAFLQQGRLIDESAGDKAVIVEIANEGNTSAHLMIGWIYLEARHLEPTNPSGGPDVSREGDEYRVAVVGEGVTVIPPHRVVSLRVQVAVLSPGDTTIRYDFVSSEGSEDRGGRKVTA